MTVRSKIVLLSAIAIAGMAVVQIATATHPRPKGATPVRVSLVPAYEKCTAPNTTQGPPIAFPSCSPPIPTSQFLTVGTPDANGAAANSVGFVRLGVVVGEPGPPEDSTVEITGRITDVRCKSGVTTCGNANAQDGPDYTGELQGHLAVRLTNHYNGPNRDEAATVVDLPQPFHLSCASTADPSIGSTCVFPQGTECLECPPPKEGVRTVATLTQIEVRDGGPNGIAASTEDNTLFMVQGIFIP